MTKRFEISFDYLCPFARNANEHVLAGLEAGADWEVEFRPFCLGQAHVEEGQPSVFEREDGGQYLFALAAGVTVRDEHPEKFASFHTAMFAARHDQGRNIKDEAVVRQVIVEQGLDADEIMGAFPCAVDKIEQSHTSAVQDLAMFGVPTFVSGDKAVFVRLMDRPGADPAHGRATVDEVLATLERLPALNEFKFTRIPR